MCRMIRLIIQIDYIHQRSSGDRYLTFRKNLPVRPDEFRPNHPDAILDRIISVVHKVPARVLMWWRLSSTFADVKKAINNFK